MYMNQLPLLHKGNSHIHMVFLLEERYLLLYCKNIQHPLTENWKEYQSLFGGTSAEKFIGSQYPKYELPYIAKSYLSESNQLQVCRVLGLSGYNAGPAWAIQGDNGMVIAVLRSRGHYEKFYRKSNESLGCDCPNILYDKLIFEVGEMSAEGNSCDAPISYNMEALIIEPYSDFMSNGNICSDYTNGGEKQTEISVSNTNFGKFVIKGIKGATSGGTICSGDNYNFQYAVSLNPADKDYILKVLGTTPFDGAAPIYVESLYDVVLQQQIQKGNITKINQKLLKYNVYNTADYSSLEPITNILTLEEAALTKKHVGTRWLAAEELKINNYLIDYKTGNIKPNAQTTLTVGQIYVVRQRTNENGKREYVYTSYDKSTIVTENINEVIRANDKLETSALSLPQYTAIVSTGGYVSGDTYYMVNAEYAESQANLSANEATNVTTTKSSIVLNNADGTYYKVKEGEIVPVLCDLNNYKDAYRYASTPWFVSNLKGDATHYELNKLFRFHTITDGNNANNEVKISIQNIKPDAYTFDVIVRDINDSDESIIVLEKYANCNLIPGDNSYIAYKIGSFDGIYESKSKYITVEVNENLTTQNSVPCGFLGYPIQQFDEEQVGGNLNDGDVLNPTLEYQTQYYQETKHRKQYFGLSNLMGVDNDFFTYKGKTTYVEDPRFLSKGFHLDCRLEMESGNTAYNPQITVDGESGYTFTVVSTNTRTQLLQNAPIIASEIDMQGSIYENVDLRKFTAYFYGGFDGWDIYRDARTNTDEYKLSNYQGVFNVATGEGEVFSRLANADILGINQQAMTSDWYAYLAGIRQFANPEAVDINVFATPGIDIVNNKTLVQETIEMIEEERADSIYVVTMPDKPYGAEDYVSDMYTPSDAVYELEDTEIDSNYTCTYYPWVKYHDKDNSQYIFLPPTKDVVRNMAMTDNTAHPWFAPAGITRGDVNCVSAKLVTKLADEDVLYEGRINPIKTFASDGVKIWGQKNLQVRESQLNRIAVRRLLLRLRKLISISCIGLIFEPNDPTVKNKFLSTVTPIFDNIKSNRGISDYRIEIDDSPEARDRRELPCKLFFKHWNILHWIL